MTGRRLATVVEPVEEQESGHGADSRGFAYLNKQAWAVGLAWIALYVALFWLATTRNPYLILVHVVALSIQGLLIAIRTTRTIFEDGIVEGLFTCLLFRIIPYYSTYYVFSKTGNPHLRWAYVAFIVGIITLCLSFALGDYEGLLPSQRRGFW